MFLCLNHELTWSQNTGQSAEVYPEPYDGMPVKLTCALKLTCGRRYAGYVFGQLIQTIGELLTSSSQTNA